MVGVPDADAGDVFGREVEELLLAEIGLGASQVGEGFVGDDEVGGRVSVELGVEKGLSLLQGFGEFEGLALGCAMKGDADEWF